MGTLEVYAYTLLFCYFDLTYIFIIFPEKHQYQHYDLGRKRLQMEAEWDEIRKRLERYDYEKWRNSIIEHLVVIVIGLILFLVACYFINWFYNIIFDQGWLRILEFNWS